MSFDFLFQPVEQIDVWLEGLFAGAPLLVALLIAVALGLRHASDPDHLVAVTSLVAVDGGDVRGAARLGAWWGAGHATALLLIGVPLILFKSSMPSWIEHGAETAVGIVILLLAMRIVAKWARGDFRAGRHPHRRPGGSMAHRHLHHGDRPEHRHRNVRTPRQALAVFAPMSAVSMTLCTAAFAWLLTRPLIDPLYRTVLIPAFGLFGLLFGAWYVGIG